MNENKAELIERYVGEIIKKNDTTNLTRITDPKQAKLLHIEDSLSVLPEMDKAPDGMYGDLGTGGGFPGVPLAIATGRKTILIDSVRKKLDAVQDVLEQLGLSAYISTEHGRIEDISKERRGSFAVLTARALSSLPSLVELASPLLQQGGRLICLKAHIKDDEFVHAEHACRLTGMKKASQREFHLSDGETFRTVIVFEKVGKPSLNLPRKVGMAQKKPLG